MKLLKGLVGLLLLPVCAAILLAVGRLFLSIGLQAPRTLPRPVWGFAIGFALWTLLYFSFSRPLRSYILAHELTHALWALLLGSRVSEIRVGRSSGHVKMDRANFLITLAPYFFPFYTVLALLLYGGLNVFYDLSDYQPFWTGLLGLTWAFHLTFTVSTLKTNQPDILENGRLFSYTLIVAINALGLGVGLALIAEPGLAGLGRALDNALRLVFGTLEQWLSGLAVLLRSSATGRSGH